MSLTGRLGDSSDPIRRWVARRLPHTAPVVGEANRALRSDLPTMSTSAPPRSSPALPATAADPRLVGTALDVLVRATLDSDRAVPAAGLVGALRLEGMGVAGATEVAAQVGSSLRDLEPAQLTATADQWRDVAILCALLARFEQEAATGMQRFGLRSVCAPSRRRSTLTWRVGSSTNAT